MKREPENDERIQEVDSESRKKSGDQQDATPEQLGASGTGGSSKTSGTGGSGTGGRTGHTGSTGSTGSTGGSGGGNRDTGSSGAGARPSETQGDERQRMGNKNPDTGTGHKT